MSIAFLFEINCLSAGCYLLLQEINDITLAYNKMESKVIRHLQGLQRVMESTFAEGSPADFNMPIIA